MEIKTVFHYFKFLKTHILTQTCSVYSSKKLLLTVSRKRYVTSSSFVKKVTFKIIVKVAIKQCLSFTNEQKIALQFTYIEITNQSDTYTYHIGTSLDIFIMVTPSPSR